MTQDQFTTLINHTIKATEARTLSWKESSVKDQFVVEFGSNRLMLDRFSPEEFQPSYYAIALGKADKDRLDEYTIDSDDYWYQNVSDLFDLVRRQVNGSEQLYDEIVSAIVELSNQSEQKSLPNVSSGGYGSYGRRASRANVDAADDEYDPFADA